MKSGSDLVHRAAVAVVLLVHAGLLVHSSWIHSPTFQEVSALPAGVYHWTTGRFSHFRVNPPLIRLVASLPVLALRPTLDWSGVQDHLWQRREVAAGADFVRANGERSRLIFAVARCACLPFSIVGALVCYAWAKSLFGPTPGLGALTLWCFCPNILGHSPLVSGDAQTAALAVLACYAFRGWLKTRRWSHAGFLGISLGFALASKSTLLVLVPVMGLVWSINRYRPQSHSRVPRIREDLTQLLVVAVLPYWILLTVYGYQNCFVRLGDYQFVSRTLAGDSVEHRNVHWGNRFQGGIAGHLPIPLPEDYVLGIDRQKRDFEVGVPCYVLGAWRSKGCWWYYLLGLSAKVPVGTLAMLVIASVGMFLRPFRPPVEGLILGLPPLAILVMVSSQTRLNEHFRYVFPVLPFLFIVASRALVPLVAGGITGCSRLGCGLLIASVFSSLWQYPHSIAYSNCFSQIGNDHLPVLLGSSADWGQDTYLVRRFQQAHLGERPILYAHVSGCDPKDLGLPCIPLPLGEDWSSELVDASLDGTEPAWLAVSVNRMYDVTKQFASLRGVRPAHTIGRTTMVFSLDGLRPRPASRPAPSDP